jgi:hypothetical protein
MSSSTRIPSGVPTAVSVTVTPEWLRVRLADGREIAVPTAWYGWLAAASDADRGDLELIEGGQGIWWNRLDEGLSVPGLLDMAHI